MPRPGTWANPSSGMLTCPLSSALDPDVDLSFEIGVFLDQRIEFVAGQNEGLGRLALLDGLAKCLDPFLSDLALFCRHLDLGELSGAVAVYSIDHTREGLVRKVEDGPDEQHRHSNEDRGDDAAIEKARRAGGAVVGRSGVNLGAW